MKNRLSVSLLATMLFAAQASAQPAQDSWDADRDGRVSLREWDVRIAMSNVFDNLDRNHNERFDIEEVELPYFSYRTDMDGDHSGQVERDEFVVSIFDRLDADKDGHLDAAEFSEFRAYAEGSDLFD